MKTLIEPLITTAIKRPVIKLQEPWLVGAVESLLILCGIHLTHVESYHIELFKDVEDHKIMVEIHLPEELEQFFIRRISGKTTIDQLNSLTADLCEDINRWIDKKI